MQRIKRYIEFLETIATLHKTVPQKEINILANGITKSAWLKMRKKKQS